MENNTIHQDIILKLRDILRYIEVEISIDWSLDNINDTISIDVLANRVNMSVRSLSSYFKLFAGESLGKYIAYRRAEYAARLFRLFTGVSTAEVSRLNGFFNPPALYSFLKKYGISKPSDLRKTLSTNSLLAYRRESLDTCYMVFKLRYGQYAVFTHIGPYTLLPKFYNSVIAFLQNTSNIIVEMASPIFEKYLNSPTDTAAEELITELWIPLRK